MYKVSERNDGYVVGTDGVYTAVTDRAVLFKGRIVGICRYFHEEKRYMLISWDSMFKKYHAIPYGYYGKSKLAYEAMH